MKMARPPQPQSGVPDSDPQTRPCVPDNGHQMPVPALQQCGRHHLPRLLECGPQPAVPDGGPPAHELQSALRGTSSLQSTTEAPRCQRQLSRSVAAITSQQSMTVATPGQLSLTVATRCQQPTAVASLSESSRRLLVATLSESSSQLLVATRCKRQRSRSVAAITSHDSLSVASSSQQSPTVATPRCQCQHSCSVAAITCHDSQSVAMSSRQLYKTLHAREEGGREINTKPSLYSGLSVSELCHVYAPHNSVRPPSTNTDVLYHVLCIVLYLFQ